MIAKMNKVTLIVLDSDKRDTLKELKKLGVLHVESHSGSSSSTIEDLYKQKELFERALLALPLDKTKVRVELPKADPIESAASVINTKERIKTLYEEKEKLLKERENLIPWGDFNPKDLILLKEKGMETALYAIPAEKAKSLPSDITVFTVNKTKTIIYSLVIFPNKEKKQDFAFTETPVPEYGLKDLDLLIKAKQEAIAAEEKEFSGKSNLRHCFEKEISLLSDVIEFEEIHEGMAREGSLSYLTGYIPVKKTEHLSIAAKDLGWALFIREPGNDDPVPTLVENPKAVQIIQPVFNLLGTVPGYRENDISLAFLLFFSLFFAMIIGDAGYGVILLALSLFGFIKTAKKGGGRLMVLLIVVSVCTTLWGAVTGTWFGSELIATAMPFRLFVVPALYSFDPKSSEVVKQLCFIIGTVHISIAHIWMFIKEARKKPFLRSLAQLGWLSMVLGLYYLVLFLVLDQEKYPLPSYALYMVFAGVISVLIFANQEGNFIKGILKGLSNILPTFLNSIGAFSDIISYIRLFAVGLASVEIAKSFNAMAGDIGGGIVGIIAGALIMLLGHTLNLAMGALSVIVHGVRLNMLEFSNHLGMEWTGIPYRPFSKSVIEQNQ